MTAIAQTAKTKWTLVAVVVAGITSLVFLPKGSFEDVTQELIALFGLIMAGILPTMVLTASALRAGNLSVKRLLAYQDALRNQLVIWIGLFLISLFASLFVIFGKMVNWSLLLSLPTSRDGQHYVSFDLIRILNSLIVMALMLLVARAVAVGNGLISLLRLSTELAISEAQARDEERHRATKAEIDGMPERKGFGDYVNLKH
ncbi:hypothetical protein C5688_13520 [Methylocystis sp. MitZ-2018]|nr:hypothetical protein C5688_13520 [Methylocystis sp. MitZ-2018]